MMVVDRASGSIRHRMFADIVEYVQPGDLWVFNDTRVVPARFFSPDGRREVLRLESFSPLRWRCMVRPGKKFRLGDEVLVGDAAGRVVEVLENGERIIEWDSVIDDQRYGHLALPHYMNREDSEIDRTRYQTVYARHAGSIAAPTAGLHFTPAIMDQLPHAYVTLHVGVGTFQPVKAERVQDHVMHSEQFTISDETAEAVAMARRVVAVGTTASRTLESSARVNGQVCEGCGATDIFIYPGYEFQVVQALLTNFHLPKSSLIMLVSALAGRDIILQAYDEAVRERYRFFSYGDCMLIL
jgi:S-adenosylmethionine:tRNA ribosyltransferase-isomerase